MRAKYFLLGLVTALVYVNTTYANGCNRDLRICPNGSSSMRLPELNCQFAPCSAGGFQQACNRDARICPDGTSVVRDPERNCAFNACPAEKNPLKISQNCKEAFTSIYVGKPNGVGSICEGSLFAGLDNSCEVKCQPLPDSCSDLKRLYVRYHELVMTLGQNRQSAQYEFESTSASMLGVGKDRAWDKSLEKKCGWTQNGG